MGGLALKTWASTRPGSPETEVGSAFPYERRYVSVEGSRISYVDEGTGAPIVLLHGNPTSKYMWRNVLPYIARVGRAIAPDLVGMGDSDKPPIAYRFGDHARYFRGFVEALGLQGITLVVHDWGSAVGFDFAANHVDSVRAVAFMEAIVGPMHSRDYDPVTRALFARLRDPLRGRRMVEDHNFFVEWVLPMGTVRRLSSEEKLAYRAPFALVRDRAVLTMFPRELPIDGSPPDVWAAAERWQSWLNTSPVPKLMIYASPGMSLRDRHVARLRATLPNLTTVDVGRGRHFIVEDHPRLIGESIASWFRARVSAAKAPEVDE